MTDSGTLIFIPDISGFTNFVSTTEISHSKHIISELLEVILNSNELDLEVAEVEGDAIFFFRMNFTSPIEDIIAQVKVMFINFHSHLIHYETNRICQCGACTTASNLTLKFIVHLGIISFISIKEKEKPHGTDVILAHKLLKNEINHKEYLLLTEGLLKSIPIESADLDNDDLKILQGSTSYTDLGPILYKYIILTLLHREVAELPAKIHPHNGTNPLRFSGTINASKEKIFEFVSNLEYRLLINKSVSKLEFEKDRVNRIGLNHECIINNQNYKIKTVSNDYGKDRLVYGELIENIFIAQKIYTYTILEDHLSGSRLTYEVHLTPKPVLSWIMNPFFRIMKKSQLKKQFLQLKRFSENIENN